MTRVDPATVTGLIREMAEAHILPYFGKLKEDQISFKSGDDPVTIADKEAESALSARLLDLLPGSNVVGEEAFAANQGILSRFSGESPVWIIDPIDGTRNFTKGSPEFGVIVALAKQNQVIAGWIYDPASGEAVVAEKGGGAYYKGRKLKTLPGLPLQSMRGILSPRIIEPYRKSDTGNIAPVFNEMTAGAHEYPRLMIDEPHFGKKTNGSMHFRATLLQTYPWDDAAGVLMHSEAGGYAATWQGQEYRIDVLDRGLLLAPCRDSWMELKNWVASFCELPAGKISHA